MADGREMWLVPPTGDADAESNSLAGSGLTSNPTKVQGTQTGQTASGNAVAAVRASRRVPGRPPKPSGPRQVKRR